MGRSVLTDRQQRQTRAAEEAAGWLLRLEGADMSAELRAGFVDWLRESPVHVAEMLRVARLRNALTKFDQWDQLPSGAESDARDVGALDANRVGEAKSRAWGWAVAAAAGLVAVALGIYALSWHGKVIRTQLGERREMVLADGSEMALAPGSEIRVDFNARARVIVLDHGEAFFHVSKDPYRPFVVSTAHARTRVLGTSFSVEERADAAVVTVIEGRVAVSFLGAGRAGGTRGDTADVALGNNQQVVVSPRGAAPVRQIDGRVELAWSQGQLVFENETVATVVRRFNTYNQMKIRVTDAGLAARPVSGVFRATDPESFVAFLESVAGVTVHRSGAGELVLESSNAAQPEVLPR